MSATTLKQSISAARSRLRISESEARRSGAAFVSAGVIGVMSKPNDRGEVPLSKLSFAGIPGTAVLAVLTKGGATFATGDFADYLNGIGDAAAIIAISKFTEGGTIAGADVSGGDELSGRRRRGGGSAARLEQELSSRVDEVERELQAMGG